MTTPFYKLMLVTHRQGRPIDNYLRFIKECVEAGVTSIQLREKGASPEFLLDYALQLKVLLDSYQVPLIINDNVDLALEVDAHGVHLGQSDGCPVHARQRLGADKWLGLSIETEDDLIRANASRVDYVAASAVFPTINKANIRTIWGLKGLNSLVKNSLHPVIAIGGINQYNIHEVMMTGAKGVAVIGQLHDAPDPSLMTTHLRQLIDSSMHTDVGRNNAQSD
ncbi:thiamine phosphate synthase [Legionella micdadei]|uniref:thiamine phosphate synthase n=1 Tax=Legionella micdadei TaxID=451 RepID=UPI0009EF8048|nr:thiamine phosphate synthase [Legionella micdadei]ARH01177.1 thiamine-phosphate diphosphorylase [Legionella micdadei]